MTVGYVAKWISLLEAIQHVRRVRGDTLKDAYDKLQLALREGGVTSRYRGEGRGGRVSPARWYTATVYQDGGVEFSDFRPKPSSRPIRVQIEIQRSDLERWWPTPPEAVTESSISRPPAETISLIEAVHDLREVGDTDLNSAIGEIIDLLATGQVPPVDALVDGVPGKIDPAWWWASAQIDYPINSAVFGEPRIIRATEIVLDREAWKRRRARIVTAQQPGAGRPPAVAEDGGALVIAPSEPTATGPLSVVLADPQLSEGLVEVCRAGRVRAEGRRLKFHWTLVAAGRWNVTTSFDNKYELIPPEDWRDLLFCSYDGLRLEGARKWLAPDPVFEPKGWAFIRFSEGDLLDLIEDTRRRREASETAAPHLAASSATNAPIIGQTQRRGGRKKGSGSIDDTERVRAMLSLLASGQARSVHEAARKVAERMVGSSQSREADTARLRLKFAKDHGTEAPAGMTWADVAGELNAN
jgi:hypothetical protein